MSIKSWVIVTHTYTRARNVLYSRLKGKHAHTLALLSAIHSLRVTSGHVDSRPNKDAAYSLTPGVTQCSA